MVHNVHLGSCKELAQEETLEKARKIKRRRLGLDNLSLSSDIGQSEAL